MELGLCFAISPKMGLRGKMVETILSCWVTENLQDLVDEKDLAQKEESAVGEEAFRNRENMSTSSDET